MESHRVRAEATNGGGLTRIRWFWSFSQIDSFEQEERKSEVGDIKRAAGRVSERGRREPAKIPIQGIDNNLRNEIFSPPAFCEGRLCGYTIKADREETRMSGS